MPRLPSNTGRSGRNASILAVLFSQAKDNARRRPGGVWERGSIVVVTKGQRESHRGIAKTAMPVSPAIGFHPRETGGEA